MTTTTARKSRKPATVTAPVAAVNDIDASPAPVTILDGLSAADRAKLASLSASSPGLGASSGQFEDTAEPERYDVGETAFEVFERFGIPSQAVCWKGVGNSALATAIYSFNSAIGNEASENPDPEFIQKALYRGSLYADLYYYATEECKTLAIAKSGKYDPRWDLPMLLGDMFTFVTKGEPQPNDDAEARFEAAISDMDMSVTEAAQLRKDRKLDAIKRAVKQADTMKQRKEVILDYVASGTPRFDTDLFTAAQHLNFFKKTLQKLRDAAKSAAKKIGDYEDADSDRAMFTGDAKKVEPRLMAFIRRNRDDLVQVLERSAD